MSNVSNLFEKNSFEKPFITGFSKALRLFLEFNFIKSISASSASPPPSLNRPLAVKNQCVQEKKTAGRTQPTQLMCSHANTENWS